MIIKVNSEGLDTLCFTLKEDFRCEYTKFGDNFYILEVNGQRTSMFESLDELLECYNDFFEKYIEGEDVYEMPHCKVPEGYVIAKIPLPLLGGTGTSFMTTEEAQEREESINAMQNSSEDDDDEYKNDELVDSIRTRLEVRSGEMKRKDVYRLYSV